MDGFGVYQALEAAWMQVLCLPAWDLTRTMN